MTDDTRQLAHNILDMRLQGKSVSKISEELGFSRAYIYNLLGYKRETETHRRCADIECVYTGLKKYINENLGSYTAVNKIISNYSTNTIRTKNKLLGKTKLSLENIIKLINYSGRSFEYLFLMSEEEVEEFDKNSP